MGTIDDEIRKRMRWELVLKSPASASAFFISCIIVFFYSFDTKIYKTEYQIVSLVGVLVAGIRYIAAKRALNGKLSRPMSNTIMGFTVVINSLCWTGIFIMAFQENSIGSPASTVAFMCMAVLASASIFTISYVPIFAILFQVGVILPAVYSLMEQFYKTKNNNLLFAAMILLVFLMYLLKQTKDFHQQISEKYRHEVNLEESMALLGESQRRVIEESAKSLHSSRLASLGEMAGGVAHEINNPLMIMSGNVQSARRILEKENIDIKAINLKLDKINSGIERIGRIVRGLRYFAKEGGAEPLQATEAKVIIADVLDLTGEKFRSEGVQLTIDVIPNINIYCRAIQISQVLLNLLNNANDAIGESKSDIKQIHISFMVEPDLLIFKVTNSGIPISQSVKAKLFMPFFTTKEVGKGTGLGLGISKGIIEAHGGRLWLDEEAEQTTFCFSLPISK